ncbi:hypothetical protein Bbelb_376870 [Branchiostoma belcheri]|nr:hypothetical protein Bbelb_376870 [Branchiostoma belcheri]
MSNMILECVVTTYGTSPTAGLDRPTAEGETPMEHLEARPYAYKTPGRTGSYHMDRNTCIEQYYTVYSVSPRYQPDRRSDRTTAKGKTHYGTFGSQGRTRIKPRAAREVITQVGTPVSNVIAAQHGGVLRHCLDIFGFVKVEKKISAGDFTTGDHSSTQRGSAVVSSQLRGRRSCGLWNSEQTMETSHTTDKKITTALLRLGLVMLLFAVHGPVPPATSGLRSSPPPHPSKTRRGEAPRIPAGLFVRGDRGCRGVEPVDRRAVAEQFSGTVEATSPEMQDGCPSRPHEIGIAIRCNPRLVCCSGLMELSIRWTTKPGATCSLMPLTEHFASKGTVDYQCSSPRKQQPIERCPDSSDRLEARCNLKDASTLCYAVLRCVALCCRHAGAEMPRAGDTEGCKAAGEKPRASNTEGCKAAGEGPRASNTEGYNAAGGRVPVTQKAIRRLEAACRAAGGRVPVIQKAEETGRRRGRMREAACKPSRGLKLLPGASVRVWSRKRPTDPTHDGFCLGREWAPA